MKTKAQILYREIDASRVALGWDLHLYIYTRREEDLASPADRVGVAWGERAQ